MEFKKKNFINKTAIDIAIENKNIEITKLLLMKKAQITLGQPNIEKQSKAKTLGGLFQLNNRPFGLANNNNNNRVYGLGFANNNTNNNNNGPFGLFNNNRNNNNRPSDLSNNNGTRVFGLVNNNTNNNNNGPIGLFNNNSNNNNNLSTQPSQIQNNSLMISSSNKNSSKIKLSQYKESFSEMPDPKFQQKTKEYSSLNDSVEKLQNITDTLSKLADRTRESNQPFIDDEVNVRPSYQQQFPNPNQMMALQQQQQQQWYQLIQMNNSMQNQFNMQYMQQNQMNLANLNQSKKKKKKTNK